MPRRKGEESSGYNPPEFAEETVTQEERKEFEEAQMPPVGKVYTFRSRFQCTKVIQSSGFIVTRDQHGQTFRMSDPNKPAIKCVFNGRNFVLNDAFAQENGLPIEKIYEMLITNRDYGRDYICVSGPGVTTSPADIKKFNTGTTPGKAKVVHG